MDFYLNIGIGWVAGGCCIWLYLTLAGMIRSKTEYYIQRFVMGKPCPSPFSIPLDGARKLRELSAALAEVADEIENKEKGD